MDETIRNLRNYFDEMVVYKDLKNSNFFSALSLPSFTRDWLLRKFADEDGHFDSEQLAEFVKNTFPRKMIGQQLKVVLFIKTYDCHAMNFE